MNITFPINKLLQKGLTADDYTIALLIKEGKYGLLKTYSKLLGNTVYDCLKRLKSLGYIAYNTIGDIIPIKEAKVTEEFINLTLRGDNFEEFYDLYPIKSIRIDNKVDYLRRNKAKCKTKYKRIVKNNLMIHDHIMDCLKWEIDHKNKYGNMAYMKQMSNWLENEEWKIIEEKKQKIIEDKEKLINKNKKTYGAEIL